MSDSKIVVAVAITVIVVEDYADSIFVKCNVNLGKILTNSIAKCLAEKLSK